MGACLGQYNIMVPNFPEIMSDTWFFKTIVKRNPPQARTSFSQVQLKHTPVKCSICSLSIESYLKERISGTLFICVHFYTIDRRNYVVKKKFAIKTNNENSTHKQNYNMRQWSIHKCERKSTANSPPPSLPPMVNVMSMTTASNTWLSRYAPCSRLNTMNAPDARPYCNNQPLKKFQIKENWKVNTTTNLSRKLFLTWNFPIYSKTRAWIYINPPLFIQTSCSVYS